MYPFPAGDAYCAERAGGPCSGGAEILIIGADRLQTGTGSLLNAFTGNYVLPGPSGIITAGA